MRGLMEEESLLMLRVYGSKFTNDLNRRVENRTKKNQGQDSSELDFSKLLNAEMIQLSAAI